MQKLAILVVEDDPLARKVMAVQLKDHAVDFAETAAAGRKSLEKGEYALCFLDLELGDGADASGLDLIPLAVARDAYSVVMSGHDSEPMVERAYALGCDDFYSKGNEASNVGSVIARYLNKKDGAKTDVFAGRFVTEDPETRAAVKEALKYAAAGMAPPIVHIGLTAVDDDQHHAFDTHWDQQKYHGPTLTKLAEGLAAFRNAMREIGSS